MKQEDKNLLLKDLCGRLPYRVKAQASIDEPILTIEAYDGVDFLCDGGLEYKVEQIKPYLFPLSSMTEEQKAELSMLVVGEGDLFKSFLIEVEFYHKHHIDYRGLIPIGLAIDATGLDIYDYGNKDM